MGKKLLILLEKNFSPHIELLIKLNLYSQRRDYVNLANRAYCKKYDGKLKLGINIAISRCLETQE